MVAMRGWGEYGVDSSECRAVFGLDCIVDVFHIRDSESGSGIHDGETR